MPYSTNKTTRFLYLIKEPCGTTFKVFAWIIALQSSIIYYLIFDQILALGVGIIAGLPLWLISERLIGYYKIGITKNPKSRLSAINNGNARKVYYVYLKRLESAGEVENKIHKKLMEQRKEGEWFLLWQWQVWRLWWSYFK